ncbi:hypothetical protein KJ632_05880 [Patescibacteria group bacterium]|nr:hypothetical protein [Patescibacteria group bacterium]
MEKNDLKNGKEFEGDCNVKVENLLLEKGPMNLDLVVACADLSWDQVEKSVVDLWNRGVAEISSWVDVSSGKKIPLFNIRRSSLQKPGTVGKQAMRLSDILDSESKSEKWCLNDGITEVRESISKCCN